MASIPFLLASIHHRLSVGLISPAEARTERYELLTQLQPDTRHQPVQVTQPKLLPLTDHEYVTQGAKPGPDAQPERVRRLGYRQLRPLYTA
ncbi:MAG TPA: hypothetical protein VLA89_17595, partial [Gemmatimonadales bacterium]|nr:hypothetical protein [Gemmatimonadales bacterium]